MKTKNIFFLFFFISISIYLCLYTNSPKENPIEPPLLSMHKVDNRTHEPDEYNLFFDLETENGLENTATIINSNHAHSGRKCSQLSKDLEYSIGFKRKIKDLGRNNLEHVAMGVWILPVEENPNAVLVASINTKDGKNLFWYGKSTEKLLLKTGEWHKLNSEIKLPPGLSLDDELAIYVWNKGKTDLLIDDLEIILKTSFERPGERICIKMDNPESIINCKTPYPIRYFIKKSTIYENGSFFPSLPLKALSSKDSWYAFDFDKESQKLDEIVRFRQNGAEVLKFDDKKNSFFLLWSTEKKTEADSLEKLLVAPQKIIGNFDNDTSDEELILNRQWRFDLKLYDESKIYTIDFKGYTQDHNPKYYECVKIISGRFFNSSLTSLLMIVCNCSDSDYHGTECADFENLDILPNKIEIYNPLL